MIYVIMFEGISVLKFEDFCYVMMMVYFFCCKDVCWDLWMFIYEMLKVGDVFLWESFLCYEVLMNMVEDEWILVSFNYKWV